MQILFNWSVDWWMAKLKLFVRFAEVEETAFNKMRPPTVTFLWLKLRCRPIGSKLFKKSLNKFQNSLVYCEHVFLYVTELETAWKRNTVGEGIHKNYVMSTLNVYIQAEVVWYNLIKNCSQVESLRNRVNAFTLSRVLASALMWLFAGSTRFSRLPQGSTPATDDVRVTTRRISFVLTLTLFSVFTPTTPGPWTVKDVGWYTIPVMEDILSKTRYVVNVLCIRHCLSWRVQFALDGH